MNTKLRLIETAGRRERERVYRTAAGGRGQGGMDQAVVTIGRTTWFPGVIMTTGWRGPANSDGRADDAVPGRGGDSNGGGGGQGGGCVAPMVEEQDGVILRHGGEGRVDGVVPECGDNVAADGMTTASKRAREILAT
jgi:hypothetical protein